MGDYSNLDVYLTCYPVNVKFFNDVGESSNGRTADSESVNRGSNPCSPANQAP